MKPVIFFDLDGVLADFVGGALTHHGKELARPEVQWDFCTQIGFQGPADPAFWAGMGADFWACLPVLQDGLCLLRSAERLVGTERIAFLSTPCDTVGCPDGKRVWVERYFPEYKRRMFLGSAKHLLAGPNKLLVDDNDDSVRLFRKAGGSAMTVPRPWNKLRWACRSDGSFDPAVADGVIAKFVSIATAAA